MARSKGIRAKQIDEQLGQMQSDARNFVGRNNSTPSRNPTAGGGREWENHKYIDKVQTKTGKIRYIYDIDTASGRHDGNAKRIGASELGNARESLGKLSNVLTKTTSSKAHLAAAQTKSRSRNTGGSNRAHDPLYDATTAIRKGINDAGKAVNNAVKSAQKAVSDGANYVSNLLSDAVANTPIKDLFK